MFWTKCILGLDRMLASQKPWQQLLLPFFCMLVSMMIVMAVFWCIGGSFCLVSDTFDAASGFHPENVFDAAFYHLFTNGGQNLIQGSHLLGAFVVFFGIVSLAIITSAFTNLMERRASSYLSGETSYRFKDHVVILGASDVLYSIIPQLKGSRGYIIIQTGKDVESTRREVFSFLKDVDTKKIVFFYGDRTSPQDISRLSLAFAKEVFIIGDSEETDSIESYRDSYNMDCVEAIVKDPQVTKLRTGVKKLPCHVLFEYQTSFLAFQFSEMGDTYREHMDFMPFNFYDIWARKVLVDGKAAGPDGMSVEYKYLDTLPDGNFINKDSEESVHLIIVGITKMGIALGLQAAHLCHFPNFVRDKSKRTRITFIDADADIEFDYLNGRYRNLFQCARYRQVDLSPGQPGFEQTWEHDDSWLDVEWEFIKGRVESPEVQSFIEKSCADKSHVVTIAVCLNRSHKSLATAMFLPDSVFANCLQILVNQRLSGTIIEKVATPLAKDDAGSYRYQNLRPFGMINCGYDSQFEKVIDERSKYVSYVYDSYYLMTNEGESKWDVELKHYMDKVPTKEIVFASYDAYWANKTKVWERISCQFNAAMLDCRLRSIGIDLRSDRPVSSELVSVRIQEEILNLQQVEHNRWNVEKLLTGYRVLSDEEYGKLEELWKIWTDPKKKQEAAAKAKKEWAKYRKQLKEWPNRAHLDICSFDQLKEREEEVILTHDVKLNQAIPYILLKEGRIQSSQNQA